MYWLFTFNADENRLRSCPRAGVARVMGAEPRILVAVDLRGRHEGGILAYVVGSA
jgi:hypothetical protein